MTDLDVVADLRAEGEALDRVVGGLPPGGWVVATPAAGWSIGHQIAHLAWTDGMALRALTDPDAFVAERDRSMGRADSYVDRAAARGAARPDLLAHWREVRETLAEALADAPRGTRVPWFGPPMSVTTLATARLMETWAHGQDVVDALGVRREPTARLRHVAHLGVRTRDFAFLIRGDEAPGGPFRVELEGPGGESWEWGPEDAEQRVLGRALDFCLLVTQRRHLSDLAVTAVGPDARRWLEIAQAFAGPPGAGRAAGASA
ncbi:TIGR03084 family metal-binding protein [Streptomyces sp. DSM 44917]|uniref:TIGR03084 family metal-binding protein n=1 Tax=Streptomyces boetiae TaxID=3075541 RepID=A0ABU2L3Z7_9ACTN|nr:TIGR03084 family metal-binding protein [Streptomyces sp. DSM 44917]MDT0306286.1 TIGR03084 family metal-binding protein [Streptomyces sp. DSM 44917]